MCFVIILCSDKSVLIILPLYPDCSNKNFDGTVLQDECEEVLKTRIAILTYLVQFIHVEYTAGHSFKQKSIKKLVLFFFLQKKTLTFS